MLFHDGIFAADLIADRRVHEVLSRAHAGAGAVLRASDVIDTAIRHDNTVARVLAQALPSGKSPEDLVRGVQACRTELVAPQPGERRREGFSGGMLRALDEFEHTMQRSGAALEDFALEV